MIARVHRASAWPRVSPTTPRGSRVAPVAVPMQRLNVANRDPAARGLDAERAKLGERPGQSFGLHAKPRRDQPYQTMQLIQWNWFLDRGLLAVEGGRLRIHYERYDDAVSTLLAAVLELQAAGDRERANEFVARWTSWDESLHGAVARRMRESETTRFTLVRYDALGEAP